MSKKSVYRCAHCARRIRRGRHANVAVKNRGSGLEVRFHGDLTDCLEAAAEYMNQYPRNSLTIHYFHEPPCSARQQFRCACFAWESGTQLEEGDEAA
jgi:hypothetical protein